MRDVDLARRRDGGGRERGGVGQVHLDLVGARTDRCGRDRPDPRFRAGRRHTGPAQQVERHLDVRLGGHRALAGMHDLQALVEARCGEEQSGHELRRCRGVDLHPAAVDRSGAVDGERQPAAAAVGHLDTELAQPVEQVGHRPLPGVGVTVERDRAVGEGGHRRDEPHHGAGQADVDHAAVQRSRRDHEIVAVLDDVDAERAHRAGHQQRVAGAQRCHQPGRTVGERGEQQQPVGERLRARQADARAHRTARTRCRPVLHGHSLP